MNEMNELVSLDTVTISREEYNRLLTASMQRSIIRRAFATAKYDSELITIVSAVFGFKKRF